MDLQRYIDSGEAVLGIELGSTRIKAVLIGPSYEPIASGSFGWENQYVDGVWTYSLDSVHQGLQNAYADLKARVFKNYHTTLKRVRSIGISAMMHGYLAFDSEDTLLTPFRTWRNNITLEASSELTDLFQVHIPQRWSIAHLHQSVINKEDHVNKLSFMTTLSGYLHWKLTGQKVLGVGDAAGMFPISQGTYDSRLIALYNKNLQSEGLPFTLESVLPKVLLAGELGGCLTIEGVALLDPSGDLQPDIPLCPPEGDAGTGMVATNAVGLRQGNVSAGTSIFAMIVLEKGLKALHKEIDLVTTPDGHPVAMVHSNNCASDLDAWVSLLREGVEAAGLKVDTYAFMDAVMGSALQGDKDCGGLTSYGYLSGEHITGFSEGRPLFVRSQGANFTLANFMRSHFYTALCALRRGMDILIQEEGVTIDSLSGHGGFFKAPDVGDQIMADAFQVPVTTMTTAGEGGAWGIALLAEFLHQKRSLPEFLDEVFQSAESKTKQPDKEGSLGFTAYYKRHSDGLSIEAEAIKRV